MNGNAQQDRDGSAEDGAGAGGAPAYGAGAAPAEGADAGGPAVEGVAPAAVVPEPVVPPAVPWRAVVVFVVLAFGLAWDACSPLWISGAGLQVPRFSLWTILMLYPPTVAALVAVFLVHRPRSVPRHTAWTVHQEHGHQGCHRRGVQHQDRPQTEPRDLQPCAGDPQR